MIIYAAAFCLSAVLMALDQWAKFWVETTMRMGEVRPFLGPYLELHAVHNYGAAWSIFAGARWVLVGVTAVMILAVMLILAFRVVRHPLGIIAGFMIAGGGIANLMDRIFLGYVVDMLRFPFWRSYPTFNVADICVVVGCFLWIAYVLTVREELILPWRPADTNAQQIEEAPPIYDPLAQGTQYRRYMMNEQGTGMVEEQDGWTGISLEAEHQEYLRREHEERVRQEKEEFEREQELIEKERKKQERFDRNVESMTIENRREQA